MSEKQNDNTIELQIPLKLVVLALVLILPTWLAYGHIHRNERANAAAHHQKASFSECIASPNTTQFFCLTKASETPYEQSNEYYDLKAQQDMSKSAFLMFIITSLGVGYIAMTLQASRDTLHQASLATDAANKTTAATKRIGNEQLKARVSVTNVDFIPNYSRGNNYGELFDVEVHVEIANSGILPAREIQGHLDLFFLHNGDLKPFGTINFEGFALPKDKPTIICKDTRKLEKPYPFLQTGDEILISGEIRYNPMLVDDDDETTHRVLFETEMFSYGYTWNKTLDDFVRRSSKEHYRAT